MAEDAIEKLEKEGKHILTLGLKFLVDQIEKGEDKLRNTQPKNDFEKFGIEVAESLLKTTEDILVDELKRIADIKMPDYKTPNIDDLLNTADHLKQLAEDAIEKLEKEGKHILTLGLKFLVDQIEKGEDKLRSIHPKNDFEKFGIQVAESLLKTIENLLVDEIKRISSVQITVYSTSSIDDLLNTADHLKQLAEDAIEKLEKEGKHILTLGLKFLVDQIEKTEVKLQNTNPKDDSEKFGIQVAESLLKTIEDILADELKRIANLNELLY